jgi:hypothetical protein
MNLSDLHPDEIIFQEFIDKLKYTLDKCEGQYLDKDVREHLINIGFKVFEMRGSRATAYLSEKGEWEEPPDHEKDTIHELGKMIEKISELLGEDIMDFYNSIGGVK